MGTFYMEVNKVDEAGYAAALRGLAFNKKQTKSMAGVAEKLAPKDYGHNKFLESIYVWLEVRAPRYWWQEADTFRLSTKQSESTMHTLVEELIACPGNEEILNWAGLAFEDFDCVNLDMLLRMHRLAIEGDLVALKSSIPEGFLQRRLWCMNYKCLRNIIIQRKSHRLPHWPAFITQVIEQLDHPELLASILK